MTRTIRLQSDSNAHARPWRVAVEQGFFAAEGLGAVALNIEESSASRT